LAFYSRPSSDKAVPLNILWKSGEDKDDDLPCDIPDYSHSIRGMQKEILRAVRQMEAKL